MEVSTNPIEGFAEVVLTAGWLCTAVENSFKVSESGSVSFPFPEENGTFIPYANLSELQVLNWVWNSGVNKEVEESILLNRLNDLKTPPTAMLPLPWIVKE